MNDDFSLKTIRQNLPRGYLKIQDEQILYGFAKGKDVLEIGTHAGRSAALMSFVAKSITTVDVFELDGYIRDTDSTYEEAKKNLSKHDNIRIIKGASYKVFSELENNFFDFLFIDGNHYYEEVLIDFAVSYQLIKKGGYIMFHDYSALHPGVPAAVNFLRRKYQLKDLKVEECFEGTVIKGFIK